MHALHRDRKGSLGGGALASMGGTLLKPSQQATERIQRLMQLDRQFYRTYTRHLRCGINMYILKADLSTNLLVHGYILGTNSKYKSENVPVGG